jgi:pimeloyl-ACP methyl ester carboxylesterase
VLVLGFASAARAAMPPPSQDPFYDVPAKLGKLANGKVLKSREIEASAAGVPLQASAWQLQFKSLDAHNRPTAIVTTVLVPDVPWTGPGERPVVSYQTAEDSADSKCAVSYALSGGTDALQTESNAATETPNLEAPLSRGWAVVAPDYQGPHSAFLAAPEEAHGVLDSLRAAVAFKPAGFSRKTPLGIWGYSGGGYATSVAALFQPSYAPKLNIVGAAIGAPAVSVRAEIDAFSGSVAGGAIGMGIAALKRAYPEAHLGGYLSDAGRAAVAASAHDCLAEAAQRYPFESIEDLEARPGILDEPKLDAFLRSISPRYMPGHPEIPIFHYHDATDEFAPLDPALATMRRWCRRGSTVDVHVDPAGEHVAYLGVGAPLAISYLADRFAGVSAPSTCG